jgi:amino acid adenylation domain-containing protein
MAASRNEDQPVASGEQLLSASVAAPVRERAPAWPTICERFAETAVEHADRIASCCAGRSLSYRQLDQASDSIACQLRSSGVGGGDIVGVVAHRSLEAIVAILGILKAGAAYLPFDISYPTNLLRHIFNDARPRLTLVQQTLGAGIARFWAGRAFSVGPDFAVAVDGDGCDFGSGRQTAQTDVGSAERPKAGIDSEAPAYVMYTSGSTGQPKGVMIPHRGVVRLVSQCDFVDLGPDEVVLHLAPLSFDASTFEIWGALLNGGRLAIVPALHASLAEIAEAIAAYGATTLWLTTGLFNLMVDHRPDGLKPLRQLVIGGDALSPPHVEKALAALPECRIVNGYGPTENTTFTCCYTIRPECLHRGTIPIGSPIRGTTVQVLDEAMNPVADGEEGELYAGGAGVAHGYLNRPDLTAERFVPDPYDPNARLYRTGDRVRRAADGNLEFLGRLDRQVKINGKRVELDGIEVALRRVPTVRDAAVIAAGEPGGRRAVVAFVTPAEGRAPTPAALRDALRADLPDYVIPAEFTILDALPLTPTGKVDRGQLARTHAAQRPAPRPSPSADGTLGRLMQICGTILGLEPVGAEDNFFDLGGTSLQLLEMHAEIASVFGSSISLIDLFECSNLRRLAAKIDGGASTTAPRLSAAERGRLRNAALARARFRVS